MTTLRNRLGFFTVAMKSAAPAADGLARVQMVPFGRHRGECSTGEFDFALDLASARAVAEAYNAAVATGTRETWRLMDYDHGALLRDDTRAAGWIERLEADERLGLVALTRWTPTARRQIDDGEYRWISPVVTYRQAGGPATGFRGASLTNDPAIAGIYAVAARRGSTHLSALTAEAGDDAHRKEQGMDLAKLVELLGLASEATEEQVAAKIADLVKVGEVAAEAETAVAEAAEAIAQVAEAAGEDVSGESTAAAKAARVVAALKARLAVVEGGESLAALRAKLAGQTAELAALRQAQLEREAGDAVAALVAAKKVAGESAVADLRTLYLTHGKGAFDLATQGLAPIAALAGGQTPAAPAEATTKAARWQEREKLVAAKRASLIQAGETERSAYQQAWAKASAERPDLFADEATV